MENFPYLESEMMYYIGHTNYYVKLNLPSNLERIHVYI